MSPVADVGEQFGMTLSGSKPNRRKSHRAAGIALDLPARVMQGNPLRTYVDASWIAQGSGT